MIPFLENRTLLGFTKCPFHVFLIDMKFIYKLLEMCFMDNLSFSDPQLHKFIQHLYTHFSMQTKRETCKQCVHTLRKVRNKSEFPDSQLRKTIFFKMIPCFFLYCLKHVCNDWEVYRSIFWPNFRTSTNHKKYCNRSGFIN